MRPLVANTLTVLGLLGLLATVSLTAPRWARLLRRDAPGEVVETQPVRPREEAAPKEEVQRTIKVKLFFQSAAQPGMLIEEREVPFSGDLARQVRLVVEELIKGPLDKTLQPVLNPETKVLATFVSASGIAYVDLSNQLSQKTPAGTEAEMITVYSIVNTLAANFPGVRKVQLLVDDRPTATLSGHIDLSRPLRPDMTLLALAPLTPAGEAGASPVPVPAAPPKAAPKS